MDTKSNPYSMSTPLVKLLIEECLIDIIHKNNWWDCARYLCKSQMNLHTALKFELSPFDFIKCTQVKIPFKAII